MAIKDEITNIPTLIYWAGMTDIPRFTTESTPPILLDTVEKAPASKNIIHIMIIFSLPQPLIRLLNFSSIVPLKIINAAIIPTTAATGDGNW